MISKTLHLKLKREVSRTVQRFKIAIMFLGWPLTTFQRRKEWICESRCRQVSVRLHVFARFFCPLTLPWLQFMLGLHFTPACVLLSVCSLHFTHSLHFTPGLQSAVCSPQSAVFILHWLLPNIYLIFFTATLLQKRYTNCSYHDM